MSVEAAAPIPIPMATHLGALNHPRMNCGRTITTALIGGAIYGMYALVTHAVNKRPLSPNNVAAYYLGTIALGTIASGSTELLSSSWPIKSRLCRSISSLSLPIATLATVGISGIVVTSDSENLATDLRYWLLGPGMSSAISTIASACIRISITCKRAEIAPAAPIVPVQVALVQNEEA
jgi:hypothetical protein